MILPLCLLSSGMLLPHQAPSGAPLHVRLTKPVGSFASKPGTAIRAVVIAPLIVADQLLVPSGAMVTGEVKSVHKVGFGIRHETAEIKLGFDHIELPNGDRIPIEARVQQVDNGRERVTADGRIQRLRSTSTISYRATGYIRQALLWSVHAELAEWLVRSMIVQVPEPEIYYPAGTEMTLGLTQPLLTGPTESFLPEPRRLTEDEWFSMFGLVDALPFRTQSADSKPSDLINLLLIGSQEQVTEAFKAAGWEQARAMCMRARMRGIEAFIEGLGYRDAPMSSLFLDQSEPDMSWEKGLNDFSKRHHIRLWKRAETWDGKEVWIGAATRDVDFAYLRPGRTFTHKVEENIDAERDKIVADLAFTSYADVADWADRSGVPRSTSNATGDLMNTDGRVAIVELRDCVTPRLAVEVPDDEALPAHGNKMYRFARREILSARNDLLRTNIYWRSFEGGRFVVNAIRHEHQRKELAKKTVPSTMAMSPAKL
ncbi:MAG TPA: LssY C-terminal domain-containing protein [Bryobacteraceae bacterium]|nr:LssY C-terminal domain-containing protein [Bryobacteraceae bacterium]